MVNNKITLSGKMKSNFTLDEIRNGDKIYSAYVEVLRDSGIADEIKILISEKDFIIPDNIIGEYVYINGYIDTCNISDGNGTHLNISVYVSDIDTIEYNEDIIDENECFIEGFICKIPTYRVTPKGREISDLHIAVNRKDGKSYYIPCICWGNNARYSSALSVGDKVNLKGRMQSRNYNKNINGKIFNKIAYELSVKDIELLR